MAQDDDDDLYDEEFDFVDDDDDEEAGDDGSDIRDEDARSERSDDESGGIERGREEHDREEGEGEEPVDEYGRPEPKPDYVVHVYEHKKFKRTIERPFTAEDAEAFATEFNRTSKLYGRMAIAGKNDTKPKKALD
jgi:hypothetical protein